VAVGLQVLVLVVAIVGVAVVARLDGGRRLRDLGWRWDRRSLLALGIGVLISLVILVAVGVPLTSAGLLRVDDPGISNEPLWAVLVIGLVRAFVLQAIPEELIFRGYLLSSLRMRPVRAVLVSGLLFGALHLISSGGQQGWGERIMYLAMPTGFGLAAGALMLTTRSLWAAVGIHGGLHLTLLAFAVLPQRPEQGSTGSTIALGNGPALWLLAGLAWAVVAVVLLVRLARQTPASTDEPADQGPRP
jgi:membrane protease YdiL (CAAX protease family)